MSRRCELTGKTSMYGNRVSHANNKTSVVNWPNLQVKRIFVAELNDYVLLKLSTRAIRTIQKCGGLLQAARKQKPENLGPTIKTILKLVKKHNKHHTTL